MTVSRKFRRRMSVLSVSSIVMLLGLLGTSFVPVGASPAVKSITLAKGNVKFHIVLAKGAAPMSGTLGKYHVSATITQPNPDAATFVLRGTVGAFSMHVTITEGLGASGLTFKERGAVGSKTLIASGAFSVTSAGSYELTFSGHLGTTAISGKIPLSGTATVSSVSGVVRVS
ncbi:MAG: hypothetical protein WA359_01390 [Acidimicrobiales bacterium]